MKPPATLARVELAPFLTCIVVKSNVFHMEDNIMFFAKVFSEVVNVMALE